MPGGAEQRRRRTRGAEQGSSEQASEMLPDRFGTLFFDPEALVPPATVLPRVWHRLGGLPRPGASVNRVPSVVRAHGGTFLPSDFDIYFDMLGPSCG